MRIGHGYDVHKLVEGRKLILGGVEIPYDKGLLGHSDADVLTHALMDALLGAAALGDIGKHFPDTDPKYKGISSILLLEHVGKLLEEHCYIIGNIDATIIAQRPKLAPYREKMTENIAKALKIRKDQICVKATTEEGLGFTGRGEGIASQAIALIETVENYIYGDGITAGNTGGCAGCGGCMSSLRRTVAAGFTLEEAVTLDRVQEEGEALLAPLDSLFRQHPAYRIRQPRVDALCRNGNPFTVRQELPEGVYRVYGQSGEFLCLSRLEGGVMTSLKNFFGA